MGGEGSACWVRSRRALWTRLGCDPQGDMSHRAEARWDLTHIYKNCFIERYSSHTIAHPLNVHNSIVLVYSLIRAIICPVRF